MRRILLLLFFINGLFTEMHARKGIASAAKERPVRVLVVGAGDNVRSNYYYDDLIAEQTGIPVDSLELKLNHMVLSGLDEATASAGCDFIPLAPGNEGWTDVTSHLEVKGEGQNCSSSLAQLSNEAYQEVLDRAEAEYLLVLNQHYLKWQDEPMRTLFHILSYSVYDKDKRPIHSGSEFFASMKLENWERLNKLIKKPSGKIAKEVGRIIRR